MMFQRKDASAVSLTLLLALSATSVLMPSIDPKRVLAQSPTTPTSFPLPSSVPSGSTVRVDGSASMIVINEALRRDYEQRFAGTTVELESSGTDVALESLLEDEIDLAAVGRPLSDEEKAQGLIEVPINREKIAIVVGSDNPFKGNLTFEQFARIFRGEITDWAEVGGEPGPIRFVDRPEISDTRRALSTYKVFEGAPFQTGATATQLAADDTVAVIQALGNDGISYSIYSQVKDQPGVTIIPMHNTLPDDPRYPYSQPRGYVYKDTAAPAVAAFLGYALAPEGQATIAAAQVVEAEAIADVLEASPTGATTATATPAAPGGEASPEATAPAAVDETPAAAATGDRDGGIPAWLWWLLPLGLLGLLLWGLLGKRRTGAGAVADEPGVPPASGVGGAMVPPAVDPLAVDGVVTPPVVPVEPAEPTLAERAGTVISSDRTSIPGDTRSAAIPGAILAGGAALGAAAAFAGRDQDEVPADQPVEPPIADASIPASAVDEPATPKPAIAEPIINDPKVFLADTVVGGAALGAAAIAGLGGDIEQTEVEATKYNVGQVDLSMEQLASVDEGLGDLPEGYGESRIVLMPRDPQWAYTYWDVPNDHKEELRRQGGQRLALRLYDVTDLDLSSQNPHNLQQFDCDELARSWYLPVPVSDRDYMAEIGYLTSNGQWLMLARSAPAHIPPVYPSDWVEDQYLTLDWDTDLRGQTFAELIPPGQRQDSGNPIYNQLFNLAQGAESMRIAGSLFGSMQHVAGSMVPQQGVSSYIFPSGAGLWALPTLSGLNMSGLTMSGIGFSASAPPIRPRQFWLVADAELIVYGATEPDATVSIGGQTIKLGPDGTFRFQMHFPDGNIDYPILAVAVDGEQARSIHMTFDRETPERNTNTKEEAVEEWPDVE